MSLLASNDVQGFAAAGPGHLWKLAVVTTHPIQYHSQWFRALGEHPQMDLDVLYCHQATPGEQAKAGFGVEFDWDVPLLDGYQYRFLKNISSKPSVGSFRSMDTPEVRDLIIEDRYDAVLVNGWHYKSAWQAIRTCWKRGLPVMVRGDSHLRTERHPLKTAVKELPYRYFINKFDACLAAGKWSTEYFIRYGARPDRVFLVPHAVDAVSDDELRFAASRRLEFRKRWRLNESEIVFAFVGKFTEKKRPLDF